MGDRHKTPRVYISGAQKRKLAADRERNLNNSLSSIPKLTKYFSTSRQLDTNPSNHLTEDLMTNVIVTSNNHTEYLETVQNQLPEKNNYVKNDEKSHDNTSSEQQIGFENDIGLWPNKLTNEMITFWIKKGFQNLQNCNEQLFEKSSVSQKRSERTANETRKCSINFFKRISQNKEIINRFWLCFSPSTGKIYCYVCKVMETNQGNLSNNGYCDWKHASERLHQHETSKEHLQAVIKLSQRGREIGCIDKGLKQQIISESGYWRQVLMRAISTIKFICERGLALRGQNEIVGSSKNGNYLGILELIAEYDPFLSAHIKKHANKGSGHINYLSSTIFEELISLMAKKVLNEIISRIIMSKYYSVSVDSTPDEGHIDQLTVIFR